MNWKQSKSEKEIKKKKKTNIKPTISDWTVSYFVLHLTVLLTAQFLKPGSYGNAFTPLALLLEIALPLHPSVYFSAFITRRSQHNVSSPLSQNSKRSLPFIWFLFGGMIFIWKTHVFASAGVSTRPWRPFAVLTVKQWAPYPQTLLPAGPCANGLRHVQVSPTVPIVFVVRIHISSFPPLFFFCIYLYKLLEPDIFLIFFFSI